MQSNTIIDSFSVDKSENWVSRQKWVITDSWLFQLPYVMSVVLMAILRTSVVVYKNVSCINLKLLKSENKSTIFACRV